MRNFGNVLRDSKPDAGARSSARQGQMSATISQVIRQILYVVLAGALIVLLILLFERGAFRASAPIDVHRQYQEYTETFPDSINLHFSLPLLQSGRLVNVDSITAGKPVILSFLSPTCYQCLQDLPKWTAVGEDIARANSVELIFVATGPTRRHTAALLRRHEDFAFPVVFDSTNAVAEVNGIPEVPSTVLVDADREVQLAGSPVLRAEVFEMYRDKVSEISNANFDVYVREKTFRTR